MAQPENGSWREFTSTCTVGALSEREEALSEENKQSSGVRGVFESGTRARKWLLGLVIAGVAAALTSYVTGGVTSGVDRVRGLVEDEPAPVGVTVTDSGAHGSGHWVFTDSISSVKSLPLPTGDLGHLEVWDAWARQHGGMDGDMTAIEVVVEGTTPYPVVLRGLTVDVVDRAPPPRGVHVVPFGGGALEGRHLQVDLDQSPPNVAAVPAPPEIGDRPAITFPYRVSQTDPEVLLIMATTSECDCSWRGTLEWTYHGKNGTTVIDDDGKPFRTVAGSKSVQYYPEFDRG